MPANQRHPATTQAPASPNAKATATYTNKDGSKIITVRKNPPSAETSQPSTPTSSTKALALQLMNDMSANEPPQTVNRKKQKRRAKAAAKAAAAAVIVDSPMSPTSESADVTGADQDDADHYDDADPSRDDDDRYDDQANGVASHKSKKSKKKKKKGGHPGAQADSLQLDDAPSAPAGPGFSKEKIWNTSSQQERERIKEFWLGLGEEDRKSLVKVEKDAVLRKMKEQQKHTCSCTVCGRKRIAIEEELEGLYDAYYEELESFANHPEGQGLHRDFPSRTSRLPPLNHQPPSRGRIVEHVSDDDEDDNEEYVDYSEADFEDDDSRPDSSVDGHDHDHDHEHDHDHDHRHDHDHDHEHEHEHEPPGHRRPHPADFLTFGNSLQVKGMKLLDLLLSRYGNMDLGGILTVADDLLKNDGKRFIEMMEQLAERRMAREEDAREHMAHGYIHPVNGSYVSHPHMDEEFDEDEEEDEEYDSQDDDYEDEEASSSHHTHDHGHADTEHLCSLHQETAMSEEQRMEEGRRMFQIFAARMFEQRVLTAYRNMVAKQRQDQLLEELAEEDRLDEQRKAKKAKDAQKRKDKAALKKQQQAEERARKEAEKAAEEAARLDEQRRRAEEQKLRAEEKRRKKEEQKRIEEEERLRKEAERQRRIVEQQEKRAEQERKARDARDKEKRLKDEARVREKEARDQKERELREKKERQDQDKRNKDAKLKSERETKAKADKDARDRAKEEKAAAATAAATAAAAAAVAQKPASAVASPAPPPAAVPTPLQTSRRPSQAVAPGQSVVLPQHPPNPASFASPKVPVATPSLPKAPTPMRTAKNAGTSQETSAAGSQASQPGSLHSQNPSPHSATPAHPSHHPFLQSHKNGGILPSLVPHSQSASPPNVQPPMGHASPFHMPPGMQQPPGFVNLPPGLGQRPLPFDPGFPQMGMRPPPGMQIPPGFNGGGGRGFPPPPGFGQPFGAEPIPIGGPPPGTQHGRQSSGGFDVGSPGPSQPIGRPIPNGRASVASHGSGHHKDESTGQLLGSSALLDDSEEPPLQMGPSSLPRHQAPGAGPRPAFLGGPFGFDSGISMQNDPWRSPVPGPFPPFGAPGIGAQATAAANWGTPIASLVAPVPMPPPGVSAMSVFRQSGHSRTVAMRLMLCLACKELQSHNKEGLDSFISLAAVMAEVDKMNRTTRSPSMMTESELLDLAETEGTLQNGGGSFQIQQAGPERVIRWVPEPSSEIPTPRRPVGQIGSPIIGVGSPFLSRGS
ncbi:hypothetical protein F5X68DRAFT_258032 [Plectosphaerella plurivora]|uniref:Stress response protein NST1 n=1 Tax=Plectosphaerella plurivora TaxID=936078 RepID=A0A9P8VKV4_9PEZI|nr:hypothetical protein F5X68DRAFT_258032 [Plectosphaerella plurivora]